MANLFAFAGLCLIAVVAAATPAQELLNEQCQLLSRAENRHIAQLIVNASRELCQDNECRMLWDSYGDDMLDAHCKPVDNGVIDWAKCKACKYVASAMIKQQIMSQPAIIGACSAACSLSAVATVIAWGACTTLCSFIGNFILAHLGIDETSESICESAGWC
ncbi:hypothetical protein PAPYR_3730 [Paratrimastix pyriformis]|uniref:Uncharacterized protein n=1 Tax=Paratrimastix pyriformis TaxID=342808 RepID=A0ABQ8ULE3_9EUKA|nr:hypothetical protein PAPYR_3730 [Paratrimastix pyriformis]